MCLQASVGPKDNVQR